MDKEANAQRVKFDVSELLSFTREEIWRLKAMFEKMFPATIPTTTSCQRSLAIG